MPVNPILSNRLYLDAVAETVWGDGGVGAATLIPIKEGDYSVGLDDPSREQEHIVGDPDAQYMVHASRRLAGTLKVGLFPHIWGTLMAWALDRDVNNEVASKTMRLTYPGIETTEHLGMKVDRLTIEGSSEGDVDASMDLIGWYERPHAGGILTYPGAGGADPDHAAYVIPEIPSLQFLNCAFVASFDSGGSGAFTNPIRPKGLQSFSINYENNLKSGPPVENRFDTKKDAAIEFLIAGRKRLTFRYVVVLDRQEIQTLQRNRLYTQLKIVGAHPSYTAYRTVTTSPSVAGSAVSVVLDADPTPDFAVGDYVFFDNNGGTNLPSVGKITALDSIAPFGVTIEVLDSDVAVGDHMFNAGFELKTAPAIVPSSPKSKAFGEFVTAEINGDVFSGGDPLLSYKAKNMALPV